jgi:uncharacterized protein YbjT (DUF2867 family)
MILVTGATGTVGRQVVEQLIIADQPVTKLALARMQSHGHNIHAAV